MNYDSYFDFKLLKENFSFDSLDNYSFEDLKIFLLSYDFEYRRLLNDFKFINNENEIFKHCFDDKGGDDDDK